MYNDSRFGIKFNFYEILFMQMKLLKFPDEIYTLSSSLIQN